MERSNDRKRKHLEDAGLLNANAQRIREHLFNQYPEFFDAHDLLQVRYEMLRAHLVDGNKIAGLCSRFGVSRQTFYNLLEKFSEHGSAGLLARKPGPTGPSKLTPKILAYAREQMQKEREVSGAALAAGIQTKFAVAIHKRTIEKVLSNLRSKKNS
jgi:transposase